MVESQEISKGTILLVDDMPINIHLLECILADKGYKLINAENGIEAKEKAAAHKPDLVLLDVMMPQMDGFETCAYFKGHKELCDIPIIFVTSKNKTKDIEQAYEAGGVDYVTKPFHPSELVARVEAHVDLHQKQRTISRQLAEQQQLIHILCHDLKNPIGTVQSLLNVISADASLLGDSMEIMKSATNNCINLIQVVSKVLAMDSEHLNLDIRPHSLAEMVNESVQMMSPNYQDKGIAVDINIDDHLNVNVERYSFVGSVMNNLISNAFKFSFPNSTITIDAQAEKSNEVSLSIRDQGIGMDQRTIQNLFSPVNNRVQSRRGTNGEKGTGFGMPLVAKFINIYNGKINISSIEKDKSEVESGTIITLILPF